LLTTTALFLVTAVAEILGNLLENAFR